METERNQKQSFFVFVDIILKRSNTRCLEDHKYQWVIHLKLKKKRRDVDIYDRTEGNM